jgi:hypothetical protein
MATLGEISQKVVRLLKITNVLFRFTYPFDHVSDGVEYPLETLFQEGCPLTNRGATFFEIPLKIF